MNDRAIRDPLRSDGIPMLTRRELLMLAGKACCFARIGSFALPRPSPSLPGPSNAARWTQVRFQGTAAGEQRNVAGIAMCWCPAGQFLMGSPAGERGRRADEEQVEVSLTRGFWIGRHEVTQGEWRRVLGAFPDRQPSAAFGLGDDYPAYWISFIEAERFCAALSKEAHRTNALPFDWEFRVPTEAQWEYACRAGTSTATAFGDEVRVDQINFGRELPGTSIGATSRGSEIVGSYPANPWGIHEMHGNVWEWCRDWYHAQLPGGRDPDLHDIPGVRNGDGSYSRIRRGGAWIEPDWACRSACRLRYEPGRSSDHIGFRVVAVQP